MNDLFERMGPPGQFGGKMYEVVPGARPEDLQSTGLETQLVPDRRLGGFLWRFLGLSRLATLPVRYEATARAIDSNAFDLAAVIRPFVPQHGAYLYTLEQQERERRNELPLHRQIATTPVAPVFGQERSDDADPTQVFLIG